MVIDKAVVLGLAGKYRTEILANWDCITHNGIPGRERYKKSHSSMSPFDLLLMFLYILEENMTHVMEFSPWRGYSTSVIANAMKILGRRNAFTTFEISKALKPHIQRRLALYDVQNYVEVVWGDAIPNIKTHLANNPDWNIGFTLIDCFHRKQFCERYTKEIFPILPANALIFIHDVSYGKNGEISTNSPNATEYQCVKNWVKKTKVDFSLTHEVFGGQTENSISMPVDMNFFDELEAILGKDILIHNESCPVSFICRNPK